MSTVRQVADGLAVLGLPAVAWRLRQLRAGPRRAMVLMYHRVSDESDYLGLCVPPVLFAAQVGLLRERARVMRLVDLVERLRDPAPLETDVAAITFDDGYRDNLDVALPILRQYGLPATVFVTTTFIDGSAQPTGERLREAVGALWARGVCGDEWGSRDGSTARAVRLVLDTPGSFRVLRKLVAELKRIPTGETRAVVADLEQLAGRTHGLRELMLDWQAVRSLAEQDVEIASHTVSHPILSRLPLGEVEQELRESKQQIENATGRPVVGFAFPNGHRDDFSEEHVRLLERLGYGYACTAERGVNHPGSDPFRLRRIGVGRDSRALFDLKLAVGGPVQPCAA